jgi:hypothetical protein
MLREESSSDTMEVPMSDFPSTAFQAFLTTEGILFGFFGFLFPIYVSLIQDLTPSHSLPAPLTPLLKQGFRLIAALIVVDAAFTISSLVLLHLIGLGNIILGIGCAVMVLVIAAVTVPFTFRYLR